MTTQKKKINKADYEFRERQGETLIKKPGEIDGLAFRIMDLSDCTVGLYDHIAQVSRDSTCRSPWTAAKTQPS